MSGGMGDLVVSLSADIAKFEAAMGRVEYLSTKTMRSVDKAMSGLSSTIAGLGAGLSVAGLVAIGNSALKMADDMGTAAEKAGMMVEKFSAMVYAFKQSDVPLESVQTGMKKLNVAMEEAASGDAKLQKLFGQLGVSMKDIKGMELEKVFLKLADSFAAAKDGPGKVAASIALMGKSGNELIPALNKGSVEFRRLMEEARELGKVIDTETAQAASKFNKDLEKLTNGGASLARMLTAELVPILGDIVKEMIEGKKEAGLFEAAVRGLTAAFEKIRGTDPASELQRVNDRLAELRGNLEMLDGTSPFSFLSGGLSKDRAGFEADIAALQKKKQELQALLNQIALAEQDRRGNEHLSGRAKKGSLSLGGEDWQRQLKFTKDLGDALSKIEAKAQGLNDDFQKTMGILQFGFAAGVLSADELNAAIGKLIQQQPVFAAAIKYVAAEQAKAFDEAFEKEQRLIDQREHAAKSLREYVEDLEFEVRIMGLDNKERAVAIELRKLEKAGIDTSTASVQQYLEKIRQSVQQQQDFANQSSFWNELAETVGAFASALTNDVGSAFDYLKRQAKQFLAEMVSIFAKRWILNMAGQVTQAGQVGQGSVAGTILNAVGSASSLGSTIGAVGGWLGSSALGSFGAGMSGATLGAGMAGPTTIGASGAMGLGAQAGSFMSGIGNAIAAIPVWGWIVAAIAAVAYAIRDKGENWTAQLGFGANAHDYTSQSAFGPQGFQHIAGNDAANVAMQNFMAKTAAIDAILARSLSATQIGTIQSNLAGYNRRTDGQPAQFAFGKGDDTAVAQLTLEFLKVKYGTVFDQIDKTFADFIRGYTGKSEDLAKAIGEMADLVVALGQADIKGLNLASLRAIAGPDGDLAKTFQSIAQNYSQLVDAFTSDAERLTAGQNMVNETFASLNMAVPQNNEQFLALIRTIDFSTEAGRNLFATLLRVAPAFQGVQQAAEAARQASKQLGDSIIDALVRLHPEVGNSVTTYRQSEYLTQLQSAGFLVGHTVDSVNYALRNLSAGGLAQLYQQIRTMPEGAQRAALAFLNLAGSIENSAAAAAASAYEEHMARIEEATARREAARASLSTYMQGLLGNASLSTFSPGERLQLARTEYEKMLKQAQGGNTQAIQGLQGSASAYLQLARELFASSPQYAKIFETVFNQIGGVAGKGAPKLEDALPTNGRLASQGDIQELTTALRDYLKALGKGNQADISAQNDVLARLPVLIASNQAMTARR